MLYYIADKLWSLLQELELPTIFQADGDIFQMIWRDCRSRGGLLVTTSGALLAYLNWLAQNDYAIGKDLMLLPS